MRGVWYLTFFLLFHPIEASAQDRNLWTYRCDHFLHGACLRLPNGTSAKHSVPADFSLHEIDRDGRRILTIYEGDAPERPSSTVSAEVEWVKNGYRLTGFRETVGLITRYSVYITSTRESDRSLHLSGEVGNESQKEDLARTLGGLRLCRFKVSRTEQMLACPRQAEWGRQLAEWVAADPGSASSR